MSNSGARYLSEEHISSSAEASAVPTPEMWINLRRNLFGVITDGANCLSQRKM
jgi:hypothetical protein